MTRRLAVLLAALVVLACGSAAPARAGGQIGLSTDGRHWSHALARPLFDPADLWVPGDSQTATFYVRNEATSAADLQIEVRTAGQDRLLRAGHVGIQARANAGRWVTLQDSGSAHRLAASALPSGGRTRLEVRATFNRLSDNSTQDQRAALTFWVTLTDAVASASAGQQTGSLARTGASPGTLIIIAAVALGVGAALKRRERHP